MIDYYRDFFERHQWLEHGLTWTVVQPLNEEITVDDLLPRLNGGRAPEQRLMEYPGEEAWEEDRPVLLVSEGEGTWGFLELAYGFGLSDRILIELSTESRVWMVTWHLKGGHTILHAADGEIRAQMREFIFTEHRVENGDPSIMAGFRTMLDALDPEDYRGKYSAAFAFIEGGHRHAPGQRVAGCGERTRRHPRHPCRLTGCRPASSPRRQRSTPKTSADFR